MEPLAFENFDLKDKPGPWLKGLREAALSRFYELGLPTTHDEEWKHTSLDPLLQHQFGRAPIEANGFKTTDLETLMHGMPSSIRLVFVNGHFRPDLSSLADLPESFKAGSLRANLDDTRPLLEAHLGRHASYGERAFWALNTALMEDGAIIYVPKRTQMKEPIHLVFIASARQKLSFHPRNLIVVDEESRAAVIESYFGQAGEPYFTNTVSEVLVGENSKVEHYKFQSEAKNAFHIGNLQVSQARNSNYSSYSFDLGGRLVRNEIRTVLDGEGTDCKLTGLYMGQDSQHIDNHTTIEHAEPHGSSRELYKGVLDGQSRGVFNGKIIVRKNAQKTDARQTNKNLLLSEDALVHTQPQLEINADDVKCSHGSTIGQLDEDALFYLRARGLDVNAARRLLTYAFASEILGGITVAPIRSRIESQLLPKFLLS